LTVKVQERVEFRSCTFDSAILERAGLGAEISLMRLIVVIPAVDRAVLNSYKVQTSAVPETMTESDVLVATEPVQILTVDVWRQ